MFKKLTTTILIIVFALCATERSTNYRGWNDVTELGSCTGTALVYSDSVYSMTDFNAIRAVLQIDDTTEDGYASDSINVHWGYQSFSLCLDSSGSTVDTCFSVRMIVDTFKTDSLGFLITGTLDANSIAKAVPQQVDTLGCAGYAIQSRAIFPEWDVYYRYWMEGITLNLTGSPIKARITTIRRIADPIIYR